jgi:hypothetical protein
MEQKLISRANKDYCNATITHISRFGAITKLQK